MVADASRATSGSAPLRDGRDVPADPRTARDFKPGMVSERRTPRCHGRHSIFSDVARCEWSRHGPVSAKGSRTVLCNSPRLASMGTHQADQIHAHPRARARLLRTAGLDAETAAGASVCLVPHVADR